MWGECKDCIVLIYPDSVLVLMLQICPQYTYVVDIAHVCVYMCLCVTLLTPKSMVSYPALRWRLWSFEWLGCIFT